ncbi:hypothetical protein LJ725_28830 [Reyranella aquatilis]|uniref:Uncharacterized protein n=1 Tax=Reyranella aquatilis TaxID=2035356 RepID=A0ABS8L556_9HYPH|nr:hypothetical protein [Reyranella aquatilis]MCC8432993.1 hypothetical protein [Reyranella aquatilis]
MAVFVYFLQGDNVATAFASHLVEAGNTWNVDNKWSVRHDRAHVPGMQNHVHIMMKGREVSVINKDGTPSHSTDRGKVPNWVITQIRDRGLIESQLIVEASSTPLIVPPEIIAAAVQHQELEARATELISRQLRRD